ncbi:hypothetical protein HD806DRAFT_533318 [Xylariaceae sp. AK1471]|nr:hypothetical protein HD806DRAFT_533318 [Xylariaceae sp. AK1471]
MEHTLFHHILHLHLLLTLSSLFVSINTNIDHFSFPSVSLSYISFSAPISLASLPYILLELGADVLIYIWAVYFRFPAHLALLGLGWAMQNIEPDAADMYLSLEL